MVGIVRISVVRATTTAFNTFHSIQLTSRCASVPYVRNVPTVFHLVPIILPILRKVFNHLMYIYLSFLHLSVYLTRCE